MDFKMFVMPAMLLLSRQISFTVPNPEYICEDGVCPDVKVIPKDINNQDVVDKAQMGLMVVAVLLMTAYYFVYSRINAQGADGKKKIWVPPKPKGSLPFGLGPAPEPIKVCPPCSSPPSKAPCLCVHANPSHPAILVG